MILVENHLHGCAAVPPEVRASLDYLSHRSAVQRADLPPHWKSVFFRGVWARLHPEPLMHVTSQNIIYRKIYEDVYI